MPVRAEETRCSAKGNILSGDANQSRPSHATEAQSFFATGCRAEGNKASVPNPTQMRTNATPLGPIERRPSAMNKKEAPQMSPGTTSKSHALVKYPIMALRPAETDLRDRRLPAQRSRGSAASCRGRVREHVSQIRIC